MSAIRIIIGVAIGICLLSLGLAVAWYWSLPSWVVFVILFGGTTIFVGTKAELRRRAMLKPYWDRVCMGIRWRRRFPTSPKQEIRIFLELFVDAFAFPARRRSCFSPDDKILDVYRALYPPSDSFGDCMELETLASEIQKHYQFDLVNAWRDDMTLGELYARVHHVA
jgi:propanediol dehydratase small subunit